ncbi:hypothetical protein DFJ69_6144 [Thermomonospora umbrina]|uniref:Uncharacterized protein n=1 Tax=Thermomonospora umbrina TaxID=111806 RepID=A0A3D9SXK9_9ACTN|nr:hypothetical protein DFJ69_6144 [Thermomonospora umbrina]
MQACATELDVRSGNPRIGGAVGPGEGRAGLATGGADGDTPRLRVDGVYGEGAAFEVSSVGALTGGQGGTDRGQNLGLDDA